VSAQLFDFQTPAPVQQKAKKAKPKKSISYTEEFETRIWTPYPRKLNCSKLMAFKAWEQLPDESQAIAIAAMPIFARSCVGKDEAYIPHCATWLNQRRFETVRMPIQRSDILNMDWPTVMKLYRMTSNWRQEYGPPPGQRGCRVPSELLGEM
jgi:hypothetical protein